MSALAFTSAGESTSGSDRRRGRRWLDRPLAELSRIVDIDFTAPRYAAAFSVVFLLVRLPWLWTGYGAETDAYRVALSALHLWRDGEYLPSRLPGYPVHELLMAPLVRLGGSVATNAATAVAALAGVLIFARIAREVREPSPGLVTLGLAFTPFLLVKSVETKDYLWALTFLLAAYLATIRSRPAAAGLLLGLAVGCRITSGLFAVPLLLLYLDRRSWRGAAVFAAALLATSLVVFLPVTLQYGRHFFAYADSRISPDIIIRSIGQYSLGAVGALATIAALAASWRALLRLPQMARRDIHVRIWILAIVLYVASFLRLPIDLGYLVPIYPFGYLLLGRLLKPYLLAGVVTLILVSGFIDLDISAMHNFNMRTFVSTVRPCRSCAELAHDWHARRLYIAYSSELGQIELPRQSVVLTGGAFPDFAVINWARFRYEIIDRYPESISMLSDDGAMRNSRDDVLFLASPDRPEVIEALRSRGYLVLKSDPIGPNWHVQLSPTN